MLQNLQISEVNCLKTAVFLGRKQMSQEMRQENTRVASWENDHFQCH